MEDWQGCLSPECQEALVHARELVHGRGGAVITVEDFLLALLDTATGVNGFLRRRGVDLDELVRTIQCEQPIVSRISGDGILSSQLACWLATAREIHGQPWLGWPELMDALVGHCERLQAKAYVAVLEVVGDWPVGQAEPEVAITGPAALPVVIADCGWARLVEQLTVMLAAGRELLVWLRGEPGSGKSALLRYLREYGEIRAQAVDMRRAQAADLTPEPAPEAETGPGPVLILDHSSPADLLLRVGRPEDASAALLHWPGPVVVAAPGDGEMCFAELARRLGRLAEIVDVPRCGRTQRLAILSVHQPVIEKAWNVQIAAGALDYAAGCSDERVATPGAMLQWIKRSAARLDLRARRGPAEGMALQGQEETRRRQELVALARQEAAAGQAGPSLPDPEAVAARQVWLQRRQTGRLRHLLAEDLRRELEFPVAAGAAPGHYERHQRQQYGDSASAGSGNLYS